MAHMYIYTHRIHIGIHVYIYIYLFIHISVYGYVYVCRPSHARFSCMTAAPLRFDVADLHICRQHVEIVA